MISKTSNRANKKRRWSVYVPVLIIGAAVMLLTVATVWLSEPAVSPDVADVVVYKRANCSCCNKWVAHLQDSGLVVSLQNVRSTRSIQSKLGVPDELRACHTAQVGNYWVEGHVPADLINEMLKEQPQDGRGLAVSGMPIGSPGMEGTGAQTYEVMRVTAEGEIDLYAERDGATTAP
jgi:hypothetical protein